MEEEFIVKFVNLGTVVPNEDINQILNTMSCEGFAGRYLGWVKADVEKSGGRITKQRLVWGPDNDPKFNETQNKNATTLLAAVVKAVEGGGDPTEGIIKFVVKK